jgi:ribonucleoside-diphosphate reductase alpha chain
VTGSREKVVLETKATAQKKQPHATSSLAMSYWPSVTGESAPASVADAEIATQLAAWHDTKKPRPHSLIGSTFSVETPLGRAFITVNENGGGHPFEVFINTAKAGSETAAVSEAIGRLISYILRLASPIPPRERMAEVVRQLSGIGGGRSLGFGPNRIRSLPDGVGQVLDEYLSGNTNHYVDETAGKLESQSHFSESSPDLLIMAENQNSQPAVSARQMALRTSELCPECGEASMVNEEGCRKCYNCGYSVC